VTELRRLTIEEYAMALAHVAALRCEDPFTKVGAVALNVQHRIIATGYNGLTPGLVPPDAFWQDREGFRRVATIHAEANLLAQFSRGAAELVAVTILPCEDCARNLVAHGVKRVLYGDTYWRETKSLEIFKFYDVLVEQVKVDMAGLFLNEYKTRVQAPPP
jgi:dCMP deaminase